MSSIGQAIVMVEGARRFTSRLLEQTPEGDWYRMPAEGVTHIAWQAGHLAVAQYHLLLQRIRGVRPGDEDRITQAFRTCFGRTSDPASVSASEWPAGRIREVMAQVHELALGELRQLPDSVWDEPVETPHPMFTTKGGALLWAPQHEMYHAGQIALVRRLLGFGYSW